MKLVTPKIHDGIKSLAVASATSHNEFIYIFGGMKDETFGSEAKRVFVNDLVVFDTRRNSIQNIFPATASERPPQPRIGATLVFVPLIDADYLYMFAGLNAQQEVGRAMSRFNLKRDLWEKIYGHGITPISREGHVSIYFQDKGNDYILVHGGLAKGKYLRIAPQRDVLLFDLKTQTWTVPKLPFYKGIGCHSVAFIS